MDTRVRAVLLLLPAALAAGSVHAPAQIVQGTVDGLGFAAANTPVFRPGQWLPIRVSLKTQGSRVFSGELRCTGIDLDGDRVAFTQPQVTLGGEAGPPKRFWCYVVAQATHELPEAIDVIDADGGRVAELPLPQQPLMPLSADDFLVLDLSYPQLAALNTLLTPGYRPGQPSDIARPYYRNIVVARMPPTDLPDRWWGLEPVNVIVWDQPDPSKLTIPQRDALLQWVHAGGQLILGLGASWPNVRKSDLAPLLPLTGEGPTVEVNKLPVFSESLTAGGAREFRAPVAVTTAELFRDPTGLQPDAVRVLGDFGPGNMPLNLIALRLVGSGRVVATAAGLRDLTDPASVAVREGLFFRLLLDLNPYTEAFVNRQRESAQFGMLRIPLYDGFVQPVAFAGTTALSGLAAFLFVAGYIGLATLASWYWLRRTNRTHLSWTVFAAFAVAASALSLGTVSLLRGLSRGVQSVGVLDVEAGQPTARGYCLFGYRSPIRQRVGLTLPNEAVNTATRASVAGPSLRPTNFLRPLARHPFRANSYVTPARYAAVPSRSEIDDVLMRATLKQFEGYWSGELGGTLSGDLRIERSTGRVTEASWLKNDLPVALAGGYLLYVDPRPRGEDSSDAAGVFAQRAAGLVKRYALPEERGVMPEPNEVVPPALNVLALPVPRIDPGQRVNKLGAATYERVDRNLSEWNPRTRKRAEMPDLPTLWHEQQGWAGNVFGFARTELPERLRMVLLACTRNFYLHNRGSDFNSVGTPVTADGMPELDVTHWLVGDQAILIAWCEEPPPARLHRNGRPLESNAGLTFYRVRMPVVWE